MQIQEWQLDRLMSHPNQNTFGDVGDDAFAELVRSIENEGLHNPILVTKEGIIVAGHQRYRAYVVLKRTTIPVNVIEGDGDREFYTSNFCTRNLSPLARARAVAGLLEEERHGRPHRRNAEGELRERIGKHLGISGRTVNRTLQLLRLPLAIQNAVDAGLSEELARKVERLPKDVQESIAEEIEAGGNAREVIDDVLTPSDSGSPSPDDDDSPEDLFRMVLEFFDENLAVLEEQSKSLIDSYAATSATPALLRRSGQFLQQMATSVQQTLEDRSRRLGDVLDSAMQLASNHRSR